MYFGAVRAVSLIWVALVMLAEVHSGWILVGNGALVLAVRVARWLMDIKIEGSWVVFLAGGLWKLRGFPLPMAPTLIIVLGAVLLGRTVDSYARPRRGRLDTAIPIVLPRCSWELSQTAARRSVVPARASAGRGPRGIAQNWVAGELG